MIGATFVWAFEHLGILSWVVEIWAPMREAGIEGYKYIDWFRDHPPEDDLKLIRWSDAALDGIAHIPWKPFDHPQLGKVEIGGWNRFHAFSNPPPKFLERELARFPKWLIWQALISPKLELVHAGAESVGGGNYKITLVVQNTGWLPSYVTKRALERKVVRGLIAEIALPAGATLVQGTPRVDAGQLEGKAYKHTGVSFWPEHNVTDDRVKVEWIVKGKSGDTVDITARHERAGTLRVIGQTRIGGGRWGSWRGVGGICCSPPRDSAGRARHAAGDRRPGVLSSRRHRRGRGQISAAFASVKGPDCITDACEVVSGSVVLPSGSNCPSIGSTGSAVHGHMRWTHRRLRFLQDSRRRCRPAGARDDRLAVPSPDEVARSSRADATRIRRRHSSSLL